MAFERMSYEPKPNLVSLFPGCPQVIKTLITNPIVFESPSWLPGVVINIFSGLSRISRLSCPFWPKRDLFRHSRGGQNPKASLWFLVLSTCTDYPTARMIIPACPAWLSLYSQGKVSYFLIPHGRSKLLNQFLKIASHSQLLGWSPSRESKGTGWK